MRRRIIVVLFMLICLLIGGCSSGNNPNSMTDESYDEAEKSEEEVLSDIEDVDSEDYASTEEMDEPDEEEANSETPVEAKGIVAMLQKVDPSRAMVDIQLLAIDPQTGVQSIITEWHLKNPAAKVDDEAELRFYIPDKSPVYGNNRDWLSEDLSKLGVTAVLANNERHAGWINYDGGFFDVTAAIGAVKESSFSEPNPIVQSTLGFWEDKLAFYEDASDATQKHYYVPVDGVTSNSIVEAGEEDWYYYNAFISPSVEDFHLTDWIDSTWCIADTYDHMGRPQSLKANIDTAETAEYLPSSERYNWSGVLSPDSQTVAFLSVPQKAGGVVELYTVPLSGGEPTKIDIVASEATLLDVTTMTNDDLYGPTSIKGYEEWHFYLLDWK